METAIAPQQDRFSSKLIAPWWHTLALLSVLFAISALGAYLHSASPLIRPPAHIVGYMITLVTEWLLVAFVWFGIRHGNVSLRDLIGGSWPSGLAILRDLGIAILFLIASDIVLAILARLLKTAPNQAMRELLPHRGVEVALFLLLALTAGICEEIIFRGYLQKQFTAMIGNAGVAVVVQGIFFGAAHGYQGLKPMLIIAVYGCLFGLLAHWRRSLRPGMITHFMQDGIAGLLARYAMK